MAKIDEEFSRRRVGIHGCSNFACHGDGERGPEGPHYLSSCPQPLPQRLPRPVTVVDVGDFPGEGFCAVLARQREHALVAVDAECDQGQVASGEALPPGRRLHGNELDLSIGQRAPA